MTDLTQSKPPRTQRSPSRRATSIDQFISHQESPENGYQAKGIGTVVRGDLNHDGIPDTAVRYTPEGQKGTNNYVRYLTVFIRVKSQLVHVADTPVGGKHYRSIELRSIKNNIMYFRLSITQRKIPPVAQRSRGRPDTSWRATSSRNCLANEKVTVQRRIFCQANDVW